MPKPSFALRLCLLLVFAAATPAGAENTAKFKEVLLHTVTVDKDASGTPASQPFVLELPERSAQLVWRVAGHASDQVRFSLRVNGEVAAADLQNGAKSKLFRKKQFSIVAVKGALPVVIEVYASVIDRSGQNAAEQPAR